MGADDYMAKPFSVPELLARVRARLPAPVVRPGAADQAWLEKVEDCLRAGLARPGFGVEELGRHLGCSGRQLRRRILACFGMTPAVLLLARRLAAAQELIEARRYATVAEVAHAVGLSPTYFSRRYRQAFRCREIKL